MTIQISVTIWTIICFVALMVILDRLLFRPLLDLMDRRREKIDGTRAARSDAVRRREEEQRQRDEERLAAKKQAMQDAAAALEAQREENVRRLAEKKAENARRLVLWQEDLEKESWSILEALTPRVEALDNIVAEKFHTSRYRELNSEEEVATAAPFAEIPSAPEQAADDKN